MTQLVHKPGLFQKFYWMVTQVPRLLSSNDRQAPAVQQRLHAYEKAAAGAFAKNTIRAVRADTAVFAAWCASRGTCMLPATPETVAAFIDAMGEQKAPATLRRYCSSIAHLHRAAGL